MNKRRNYKEIVVNLFHRFVEFSKYNRQFLSFVILSLLSCTLLRVFTVGNVWRIKPLFFDFSFIMLLASLSYFFKPRNQYKYYMIVLIIFTVMNVINSIYYAFYSSYASISLLSSLGQATDVTDAVFEKIKITNFVYLLMPLILFIIHKRLLKKDYFQEVEKVEVGKKLLSETAIVGGIFLFLSISMFTSTDASRISKLWNREYIVENLGIILYQGNDVVQTVSNSVNSLFGREEAMKRFKEYYEKNERKNSNNEYTNKFKGYNVIAMHMESVMSFLVDKKINGKEITPNLNKLVKESMYFDNFYPTVSVGTSSDTEFTFNTSLMPVQSGTVFVSYYNRKYITLETLLADKKYYTFSMHGNKASMWNRHKMHKTLGYMDFYSKDYFNIDEEIGMGLSDRSFFKQSISILKDIQLMVDNSKDYDNYMGTMITLSNHTPFNDEYYMSGSESFDVTYHTGKYDSNGKEIILNYLEGTTMGNYIKSVHYADKCLGEFLSYIKSSKDFDKTLFVFYGDHAAQLNRSQYNLLHNYDFVNDRVKDESDPTYVDYDYYANELFKKTPLIFWTKNKEITGKISYPMGMIDCLPTLGNMLGIKNKYALGNDIFEIKSKNIVVFPNGNFLTDKLYYYNSKNESKIFKADTIDDNYIEDRKKYAEQILGISNDIIVYDLIKRYEGEKNEK